MFKPTDFLLPDGTPMDADEIALMLNAWPAATPPPAPNSLPGVYPNGRYETIPVYSSPPPVAYQYMEEVPPLINNTITSKRITLYDGVINYIFNQCTHHVTYNRHVTKFAVSVSIYYSLRDELNNRYKYGGYAPIWTSNGYQSIQISGPAGPISFYITEKEFEITPLFEASEVNKI